MFFGPSWAFIGLKAYNESNVFDFDSYNFTSIKGQKPDAIADIYNTDLMESKHVTHVGGHNALVHRHFVEI